MSSLYSYKDMPISRLLKSGNSNQFYDRFTENTTYQYVIKNETDGNGAAQTDIGYYISGTSQGPQFSALNSVSAAANGNSWGTSTAYYSPSDDSLGGKGNTNANVDVALSDYVKSPYTFSKLRCILIGGSGGGSGGNASNAQYTGASGGTGAYFFFELTLDAPHPDSTLNVNAGGSGNGGRGSNRSGGNQGSGGGGGIGQRGADAASSVLTYYSGVNQTTTTVTAGGGGGGRGAGAGGAGGTATSSGDTNRITEIVKNSGWDGQPAVSVGGGTRTWTAGSLYNTNVIGGGSWRTKITTDYANLGTANIPYYGANDINNASSTNGALSCINEGTFSNTVVNNTSYGGGIGGQGGKNVNNDYGFGGGGGSGGYARVFFIV